MIEETDSRTTLTQIILFQLVKVIVENDNVIQLEPSRNITVTGSKFNITNESWTPVHNEHGKTIAQIFSTEDDIIRANFPTDGINLIYTGKDVAVKVMTILFYSFT